MRLLSRTGLIVVFLLAGILWSGCDLSPSGSAESYRASSVAIPTIFGTVEPRETTAFAGTNLTFKARAFEDTTRGSSTVPWRGAFLEWQDLEVTQRTLDVAVQSDTALTARFIGRAWYGNRLRDVANNGIYAGESLKLTGEPRAFRGDIRGGGMELGTLGGEFSQVTGISADGRVIVGYSENEDGEEQAYRWTETTGMDSLRTLFGDRSRALGVSGDGGVVVGWTRTLDGSRRAFWWTAETGVESIGTLGGSSSIAVDVTVTPAGDTLVVGQSTTTEGDEHVFRWTPQEGMSDLGTFGSESVTVRALSADGSTIVGTLRSAQGDQQAFRRTRQDGVQEIGNTGSRALDVSATGAVVVGQLEASGSSVAFRWTAEGGAENLNQAYASVLVDRESMRTAMISPNGQFVAGLGFTEGTGIHSYIVDRGLPRQ